MYTELRHTNEKLSALTKVLPDLAIVVNQAGQFTDIFGADDSLLSAETRDLAGQHVADLLPAPLAKTVLETIDQTLSTNEYQTLPCLRTVGTDTYISTYLHTYTHTYTQTYSIHSSRS